MNLGDYYVGIAKGHELTKPGEIYEKSFYEDFSNMVENKTAIYISHRLSSCQFCDEITVFDQGQIVQKGSHSKLVEETDGQYFKLWNAQAQYYA